MVLISVIKSIWDFKNRIIKGDFFFYEVILVKFVRLLKFVKIKI